MDWSGREPMPPRWESGDKRPEPWQGRQLALREDYASRIQFIILIEDHHMNWPLFYMPVQSEHVTRLFWLHLKFWNDLFYIKTEDKCNQNNVKLWHRYKHVAFWQNGNNRYVRSLINWAETPSYIFPRRVNMKWSSQLALHANSDSKHCHDTKR
jgi:hypothetical protein